MQLTAMDTGKTHILMSPNVVLAWLAFVVSTQNSAFSVTLIALPPHCLAVLAAHYPPLYHGSDKSKFGKGAKGDALYRRWPKHLEDRLPVLQKLGPFLGVGVPNVAYGPGPLSYIRSPKAPDVVPSQSSSQGYLFSYFPQLLAVCLSSTSSF